MTPPATLPAAEHEPFHKSQHTAAMREGFGAVQMQNSFCSLITDVEFPRYPWMLNYSLQEHVNTVLLAALRAPQLAP